MHALAFALVAALAAGQGDVDEEDEEFEERARRLSLVAWGGQAFQIGDEGEGGPFAGAEVAWAFDVGDVGVLAQWIRLRAAPDLDWTPVVLARFTERFQTGPGVEASFTLGLGAGRTDRWVGWYQLAVGVRVDVSPVFLAGELSLEQYDLVRLGAGVGVRF